MKQKDLNFELKYITPRLFLYLWFQIFIVFSLLLSACSQSSAYDASKASSLTEEQRREMDIMLFNEVYNWNTNTNRCGSGGDINSVRSMGTCRAEFFRSLASEGFEVADIISRFYDLSGSQIKGDLESYERLHRLAKQGDKSALCFAEAVFGRMQVEYTKDWPYTWNTEFEFTKQGAALGLPVCVYREGLRYLDGSEYPKDEQMAIKKMRQAAVAGVYAAQSELALYFQKRGVSDPDDPFNKIKIEDLTIEDMKKRRASGYIPKYRVHNLKDVRVALCWGRLADFYKGGSGTMIADTLRQAAMDDNYEIVHPEYMQLAREWDERFTPFKDKPTTPQDCINIEEGK